MKKPVFVVALALLFTAATPSLHAQTLTPGTWTGSILGPSGESADISYEVKMENDTLKVTLNVPEGPSFPFVNVRFEEGKLLFEWEPGVTVRCALAPTEAGGYQGDCTDDSGQTGTLVMVPPKPAGQ